MTQEEALKELIDRKIIEKFDELKQENYHCDNKLQEYVRAYCEENAAETYEIISLIVDADTSLITRENSNRHSALFDAILHDKRPIIDLFLEKNPSIVFYQDSRKQTMLHYFARRTQFDKYVLNIARKNPKALKTYDFRGFAPVHIAVDSSNPKFLEGLFKRCPQALLIKTQTDQSASELAFKKGDYKTSQWFHAVQPTIKARIESMKSKSTEKTK